MEQVINKIQTEVNLERQEQVLQNLSQIAKDAQVAKATFEKGTTTKEAGVIRSAVNWVSNNKMKCAGFVAGVAAAAVAFHYRNEINSFISDKISGSSSTDSDALF